MAKRAIIVEENDKHYPAVEAMIFGGDTKPAKEKKEKKKKGKEKEEEVSCTSGYDFDDMNLAQAKKAVREAGYLKRISGSYTKEDLIEILKNGGVKEEGEEEKEEESEEEKAVEVGMKVTFKVKGKEHKGKVKAIDYDKGKVKVKSKVDGKTYSVDPEKLSL